MFSSEIYRNLNSLRESLLDDAIPAIILYGHTNVVTNCSLTVVSFTIVYLQFVTWTSTFLNFNSKMYLMYTLNENGERVYTLKVSQMPCSLLVLLLIHIFLEKDSRRPSDRVCPSCTLLPRRQIFTSADNNQETLRTSFDPAAATCLLII